MKLARLLVLGSVMTVVAPHVALADPLQIMTFTGIAGNFPADTPWEEDGITATGNGDMLDFNVPDSLHLDAEASPYSTRVDFTTGSQFAPVSVDIHPVRSDYCAEPGPECTWDDPVDYIAITGFLEGAPVASIAFYLPSGATFETISLASFPVIDTLRVGVQSAASLNLPGECTGSCGHFDVDNVVLEGVSQPTVPALTPVAQLLLVLAVSTFGGVFARERGRNRA